MQTFNVSIPCIQSIRMFLGKKTPNSALVMRRQNTDCILTYLLGETMINRPPPPPPHTHTHTRHGILMKLMCMLGCIKRNGSRHPIGVADAINIITFHVLWAFVCFVALRPKSTAVVMAGRSVHLTTLFPGQA